MSFESAVQLNIGGKVFEVEKSTLTNLDGFFKTMLESEVSVINDDLGRIFIDRSPRHFELILNFVRDNKMELPDSQQKILEIQKEAQYYQLDGIEKLCNEKLPVDLQKQTSGSDEKRSEEKNELAESMNSQRSDIVKLDIGGTIFQTTKSTLSKFDGFFKTMLETDVPTTKDNSGCLIVNRDPKHFETILNYMRDGHVALPQSFDKDVQKDIQEVQQEADYYMMDGLIELCEERIPIDLPAELKIIKTEEAFKQVIQNLIYNPGLIIDYLADSDDRAFPSDMVKFSSITEKYGEKFDCHFKPFQVTKTGNPSPTSNSYQIFERDRVKYEGNFDDVDDGIKKYFKNRKREMDRYWNEPSDDEYQGMYGGYDDYEDYYDSIH